MSEPYEWWSSFVGERDASAPIIYIIGVRRTSEALEKKLLRRFGGFRKLSYLCTRNFKERVVGSVRYMIGAW